LARLRPDLEIVRIEAPHLILQRAPEQAAEAISEFFLRCRSTQRELVE